MRERTSATAGLERSPPRDGRPNVGLSAHEVEARRRAGQGNTAPDGGGRTYGAILRENVFTFVNNVLFVLGLALVAVGRPLDALISVGVIMTNVVVSVAQEVRAKRTLDRVALLARPRATVVREGRASQVAPEELVIGDLLRLAPGDQIVLDGHVLEGRLEVPGLSERLASERKRSSRRCRQVRRTSASTSRIGSTRGPGPRARGPAIDRWRHASSSPAGRGRGLP
jgi:hypothetical protein